MAIPFVIDEPRFQRALEKTGLHPLCTPIHEQWSTSRDPIATRSFVYMLFEGLDTKTNVVLAKSYRPIGGQVDPRCRRCGPFHGRLFQGSSACQWDFKCAKQRPSRKFRRPFSQRSRVLGRGSIPLGTNGSSLGILAFGQERLLGSSCTSREARQSQSGLLEKDLF